MVFNKIGGPTGDDVNQFWTGFHIRQDVGSKPQGLRVFGVIGGLQHATGDREEPGKQVQQ